MNDRNLGRERENVYRLPEGLADDLEKFRNVIDKFARGEISADEFNAFRGLRGVCPEKEPGRYMVRNRLPAGMLLPHQMRRMAEVARKYGNGWLHLSTRECVQVHYISLEKLSAALTELFDAGLSARNSTGNAVRNITACPDAGVCPNETFDVTAYATGLTEFLLSPELERKLPRKYKLTISGCRRDCAGATVNDLGLIAKKQKGVEGFSVYIGGGMGAGQRVASLLEDFVPATEVHLVAEAVKRILDKHGDRENRRKARIRHLVERVGMDTLLGLYREELVALKNEGLTPPHYQFAASPEPDASQGAPGAVSTDGFDLWKNRNVKVQKQPGWYAVEIPVKLGDIPAEAMNALADVVEKYGEKMLRVTLRQNFQLRWVPESALKPLYKELSDLKLADVTPSPYRDIVSCIGTSTCCRGICFSRGLASAINEKLVAAGLELDRNATFDINISGCPNSCGRHPIAAVGFTGVSRRINGRMVPAYILQLGGRLEEGKTRFAEGKNAIPARNIPEFMKEFTAAFARSQQYPDFDAFLAADGVKIAETLTEKFQVVPPYEEDRTPYCDWGSDQDFGPGSQG